MSNYNYICLVGNLTYKPDLSYTPSGVAVVKMRIAVNEIWKNKDGVEVKDTLFIDVTVWKKQAETCAKYLEKGSSVMIAGKLKLNRWESPEGEKKQKFIVVARQVMFLGKPNLQKIDEQDEKNAASGRPADQPIPPDAEQDQKTPDVRDEDIPF